MRLRVLGILLLLLGLSQPAWAVSKEIIQLQRDVALLQDAMRDLQRSVDEKNAVLRTLIEQSLDAVNRMNLSVAALQKVVQDSTGNSNARVDAVAGQMQSLNESLEEVKSRLGKLQQQLADTQSVVQSLDSKLSGGAPPPTGAAAGTPSAGTPVPSNIPSAEVLYSTALRDFTSGKYELARQEFTDYLRYYSSTDLAANAQFYIGETFYAQKDYDQAIVEYDKVLERYPKGYKLAAAQLKKGYALLELDRTDAGVRELRAVVNRFPNSDEARLARERLRRLGVAVKRVG